MRWPRASVSGNSFFGHHFVDDGDARRILALGFIRGEVATTKEANADRFEIIRTDRGKESHRARQICFYRGERRVRREAIPIM
jgi:hypothetical protein